jgi:hypothetical protein
MKPRSAHPKPFLLRPLPLMGFAAVACAVAVMITHGWSDLDIARHEARTTATVTRDGGHKFATQYRYEVNGQSYTGYGDPGYDEDPWSVGRTFDISYSAVSPSCSVAHSPYQFISEISGFWAAIAITGFVLHRRHRKAQRAK